MAGRVGRLAPGHVFGPPRAFAGHQIGIGARHAGVLDRLVCVDGDPVFSGAFGDEDVVAGHVLAIVILPLFGPVRVFAQHAARIGDIAGLDRMDAVALVIIERGLELAFVEPGIARRFVVAHDLHTLRRGIGGDAVHVEIGIGGGELKIAPALAPPSLVPAFDQHGMEAVFGGEIDIVDGVRGGGAVLGACVPAPCVEMHRPPDADIFVRLRPARIAQPIGRVEIEQDIRRRIKSRRVFGDQDRAPWCDEGRGAADLPGLGGRREHGAEALAFDPLQPEAAVILQRRFVDRDMEAICAAQGQRRMRGADLVGGGVVVDVFVAVPLAARDPPSFGFARNIELGQLLVDHDVGELILIGKGEAKPDAAVEDPRDEVDPALGLAEFGDGYADFAIVVADDAVLAPWLLPLAVMIAPHRLAQRHAVAPFAHAAQQEAEAGRGDYRLAVALHGIMRRFRHSLEGEA